MAKRFTDTNIWKNQRWFRKLDPIYKLVYFYIKDQCSPAGIWKIDCSDIVDDLGIENFDLTKFIDAVNTEFDKISGKKIKKERIKLLKNNNLWLTGFVQFQCQGRDLKVSKEVPAVKSALDELEGLGILSEGLEKGYLTLKEGLSNPMERDKDKDKDKEKDKVLERGVTGERETIQPEMPEHEKQKLILPQMAKVWQDEKPEYSADPVHDNPALLEIARFICTQAKTNFNPADEKIKHTIIEKWKPIAKKAAKDDYHGNSLKQVAKHIQTIISKKNGHQLTSLEQRGNGTGRSIEFDRP